MRLAWFVLIWCCFAGKLWAGIPVYISCADTIGTEAFQPLPEEDFRVEKADTLIRRDTLPPISYIDSAALNTVPIIYLPDSLIRDTLRYEFTKIKDIAYRTRWTKELYKLVFVNPAPDRLNVMRTQNSEERFRDYEGKTIKNISIKVLPPYGTSVYDTTYYEESLGWLQTVANKTHLRTAASVVRKQLTIHPGMELVPFELVQNEILLRRLDYMEDATIMVSEVEGDPDAVDLTVICKDEFSWGGSVESNFINSFEIGLKNKNFMKLGHILNYEFSYHGNKDKRWGNLLEYKVNSIFGTHFDLWGYYQNDYNQKLVKISADRQFLTSMMKWAGGLEISRVYYSDNLPDRNVTRLEKQFDYNSQDAWLGRSFLLKNRYSYNRNYYLTGRFFTTFFRNRPEVSSDTNHLYYNRLNSFLAFTFTKIKYYKANLIYDFGRTEDIPTGLYAGVTTGFEHSEFENSGYIGMEYHYSHFNTMTERYYSIEALIGSYVNDGGFERGFLQFKAGHISNLCSIGRFRYRFYNTVNYTRGIRRYPNDYLYIQDSDIRGFRSDTLRGVQKLSASLSSTLFFPYIKKGFRTSLTTFVDAGAIANERRPLLKCKTYWGLGVALNIRNDNVVFKNVSFRFSWYPTIPNDGRSIQAILYSGVRNGFFNYQVSKPQSFRYE